MDLREVKKEVDGYSEGMSTKKTYPFIFTPMWSDTWDSRGWMDIDPGFGSNITEEEWNESLLRVINSISTKINDYTKRGGALEIRVSNNTFSNYFPKAYSSKLKGGKENVSEKLMLSGRYNVIIDEDVEDMKVIVYDPELPNYPYDPSDDSGFESMYCIDSYDKLASYKNKCEKEGVSLRVVEDSAFVGIINII